MAPAIVRALRERATKGDRHSALLLCALSSERKEQSEAAEKPAKRSLAMEWANEPEWVDSDEDLAIGMPIPLERSSSRTE